MTNGSVMKVESNRMLPLEHSAILLTCILKVIIGLENEFLTFFLEWPLNTFVAAESVNLRALRAHFSLLKCLKPFPATVIHPWPHTGRISSDPLKSAYTIICLRNAPDFAPRYNPREEAMHF